MKIEKLLLNYKTKTITEKELKDTIGGNYKEVADKVNQLVSDNLLEAVVASKTNGRTPALYNKYRIILPEKVYTSVLEDIKLLHPIFDHQEYFNKPELFLKHRNEIEDLSSFLWRHSDELKTSMSINERSLRIWGREKLLKEVYKSSSKIFKFRDWDLSNLNFYETPEPFFEYIHRKSKEMNVLIVENKDTWYTLRKVMIEQNKNFIFGREYHVLLYGEGRKITRGTGRLEEYNKEMLSGSRNHYYYFGDLDFEGISIYKDLSNSNREIDIHLCIELYDLMLSESDKIELPMTKDNRDNDVDISILTSLLSSELDKKIRNILDQGRYIPQEILNYKIFDELMKGKL